MGRKKRLSIEGEIAFGTARTGASKFTPPKNVTLQEQLEWYNEYYKRIIQAAREHEEKRKSQRSKPG